MVSRIGWSNVLTNRVVRDLNDISRQFKHVFFLLVTRTHHGHHSLKRPTGALAAGLGGASIDCLVCLQTPPLVSILFQSPETFSNCLLFKGVADTFSLQNLYKDLRRSSCLITTTVLLDSFCASGCQSYCIS